MPEPIDTHSQADSDLSGGALVSLLYEQLRALARERILAGPAMQHSLQATALVHEVWLRLAGSGESLRFRGEGHFRAVAAQAMRWILVDHARRRTALRRGGGEVRSLSQPGELAEEARCNGAAEELLALDEALAELARSAPRKAQVIELRHFGGLTVEETAQALAVSAATVKREWQFARAWLLVRLDG